MTEIKGEDPVEQGLENELILESIFKFLPVRTLLICSQVSSFWKYQAHLYIRDHRKCTTGMTGVSKCCPLKELDQIIGGMPVVPFNSLHVYLGQHVECAAAAGASDTLPYDQLMSKFRLKHLRIMSAPGLETCPATFPVLRLLSSNASNIKTLRFQFMAPLLLKQLVEEQLELPNLEELELQGMHNTFWETGGDFLQSITGASSKLKRITHDGYHRILEILPQDKYHLLTRFNCNDLNQSVLAGREDPCMKLARSGPALTNLEVSICGLNEHSVRTSYEMLQLFLCSGWKSMKTLRIYRICPLHSMMTFPPLEQLQNLRLSSPVGCQRFMDMIQPIQFGRLFPKLEAITLECTEGGHGPPIFSRSPQLEDETEVEVVPGSVHSSPTTSLVQLTADVCRFSFLQLKQGFPHVTSLTLGPDSSSAHAVPFRQIFRLWPELKRLSVNGMVTETLYNVDAEFCGIDQAEVELLWLMEEAELRNLQIVPKRPCPLIMTSKWKDS